MRLMVGARPQPGADVMSPIVVKRVKPHSHPYSGRVPHDFLCSKILAN